MKNKILIVYYSLQGHTREISEQIKRVTGGDVFEIELKKPYSLVTAYTIGLIHARNGHEPSLKKQVTNIEDYDVIFIGSPIWWYTIAPPIKAFINSNNLENKTLVPFCTHAGDYGDFIEKFKRLCSNSNIMSFRDFHNSKFKNENVLENEIKIWANKVIE